MCWESMSSSISLRRHIMVRKLRTRLLIISNLNSAIPSQSCKRVSSGWDCINVAYMPCKTLPLRAHSMRYVHDQCTYWRHNCEISASKKTWIWNWKLSCKKAQYGILHHLLKTRSQTNWCMVWHSHTFGNTQTSNMRENPLLQLNLHYQKFH